MTIKKKIALLKAMAERAWKLSKIFNELENEKSADICYREFCAFSSAVTILEDDLYAQSQYEEYKEEIENENKC